MAYLDPIFTRGLYAGANRHVLNGMVDASKTVARSQQGLAKARQLVNSGNVFRLGLCSISQATLVTANRWKYRVEVFYPPSLAGGGISAPNCSSFDYLEVLNIREHFHSDGGRRHGHHGPGVDRRPRWKRLEWLGMADQPARRHRKRVCRVRPGRKRLPVLRPSEPDPMHRIRRW